MAYRYIGKDAPVSDAAAKAAGTLRYGGDMELTGMLHMHLVLSPVAHGQVTAIDSAQALAMEGVVAVLTSDNSPSATWNRGQVRAWEPMPAEETLFTNHVRFVGDRVAAVLAETPELAAEAAGKIRLEITPLPPVFDARQAEKKVSIAPFGTGDFDAAVGETFTHHTCSPRLTHMAMEPHCAVANYEPGRDMLTVWTATQSIFGVRSAIGSILDMPLSRIRVLKAPMGGSFGGKQEMILEPLAAWAAKCTGRPVKLQMSRAQVMQATILKHPMDSTIRVKFTPDGTLQALDCHLHMDAGGYLTNTPSYTHAILGKLGQVYRTPVLRCHADVVCTNTPISGSYRGWGAPEGSLILENAMNAAARHFGFDPVALRLKNALPPEAGHQLRGTPLYDMQLQRALTEGAERFCWNERRARCACQDKTGRYRTGVGVAVGSHSCGFYPLKSEWGTVSLQMQEDGSVSVNCNLHDHGCGSVTALQRIAAEVLRIDPHRISVPEGDTAYNPMDNGCYASRTVYILGGAVAQACEKLAERLRELGAAILNCVPAQIDYENGELYRIDQPNLRCSFGQAACYAAAKEASPLYVTQHCIADTNPAPAAVHFAEVEVDTYTGQCRIVDYLAVQDVGRAINPATCRGQIGSALQQGAGLAFCEQILLDPETGAMRNAGLSRYPVFRASELPKIDVLLLEQPSAKGPFGAKSIGEVCYVPVAPALIAAVNDALDTDLYQLPLTPEKILQALEDKEV